MKNARGHLELHQSLATKGLGPTVASVQLFGEFDYAAKSWPQEYRVLLKAEVLAGHEGLLAKDNQRYVVTSLCSPTPRALYPHVYCQRGQAKNWIKQVKTDLKSDRTSASTFLANLARLLLHLPSACLVKALLAKVTQRLGPNKRATAMLATP